MRHHHRPFISTLRHLAGALLRFLDPESYGLARWHVDRPTRSRKVGAGKDRFECSLAGFRFDLHKLNSNPCLRWSRNPVALLGSFRRGSGCRERNRWNPLCSRSNLWLCGQVSTETKNWNQQNDRPEKCKHSPLLQDSVEVSNVFSELSSLFAPKRDSRRRAIGRRNI